MDLLFKRYASPFLFLDGMLNCGRFFDFVCDFIKTINQEREEQNDWEFFLHKVWEGSFSEFKEDIENNKQNQGMSEGTIETTIQQSMQILNNFNPEQ